MGEPRSAIPAVSHASDRLTRSNLSGSQSGNAFDDSAPDNGVLVGLRVAKGRAFGGVLQAIQPVYQVENRYVASNWYGDPDGEQLEALAPAGYAVGALQVRRGLVINGIRAVFYRVTDQALDADDVLMSEYLGVDGSKEETLDARGGIVTGLFGNYDGNLRAIGISFLRVPTCPRSAAISFARLRCSPSETVRVPGWRQGIGFRGSGTGRRDPGRRDPGERDELGRQLCRPFNRSTRLTTNTFAVRCVAVPEERRFRSWPSLGRAVAGLRLRAGLVLNAVQLAFAPLRGTRLDTGQMSFSEWIGADGGNPREFSGGGRALAGVFGKHEEDLHGLGVLVVERLRIGEMDRPAKETSRTWTSADGRFTVAATLVEVVREEVVLRKEDGAVVRIFLDKLSDSDRTFIEQLPAKQTP